ncbi:hypothetical protein [Methylobacterium sp. J-076]|uniref:hypothetical protein n=1 Tax=Methylobacterium sp. J-076 TaxID=2836655 RepID=UPI001FB98B4F|nr:hypothetical protein [Methylobacterium sp. J-076]MCJ2014196.1 hypothetical protein [Methylobacterium sp. J-076]
MAGKTGSNLVLRSVYLPDDLDQELKVVAFHEDRSKNDIMREVLQAGLRTLRAEGDRRFVRQKPAKLRAQPVKLEPMRRPKVKAAPDVAKAKQPAVAPRRAARQPARAATAAMEPAI